MEKFQYGDEKLKYERLKEKALEMGLKEYQIKKAFIPEDIGSEINNNFPELNEEEEELLEKLFTDRERAFTERDKIIKIINPLILEEAKLSSEIDKVNKKICNIQGHRLDEDSLHLTGAYSYGYICLVCKQFISSNIISDKDVLVKNNKPLKKIKGYFTRNKLY